MSMRIGMTLPSMATDYDRDTTIEWCRLIDEGPFASLACGERIAYHNQEMAVLLSAAAALTEHVRIVPSLYVLPMHSAAFVAKQVATLDVLSGGRVTLCVGVGGREQDYRVMGAPFERRFARLDEQVREMKRLWSGVPVDDETPPVGPLPVQEGGPPLWAGAMGPKSLRRAAEWADGVMGFSMGGDPQEVAASFVAADAAWHDAGRPVRPHRISGFWYALGPGSVDRVRSYAYDYLKVFGEGPARALASRMRVDSVESFRNAVRDIEAEGCEELMLVPTSADPEELERTLEALAGR